VALKSFTEEVLPVDSVKEYFEHFPVLELDFIFYRPLLDQNGQPNQNYGVLKNYAKHLKEGDRIILKVPQIIMAQKIRKGDYHVENPVRWIQFSWTRDWGIIRDQGEPGDGKRAG
jgi:hypothetical protein